jgi:RNA polymerase subunit RPABC4/transcription elongation factor Spt4
MARRAYVVFCVLLMMTSLAPTSVSSYDSGGIEASDSTLSILPASPTAGGSITGSLTLSNTNSQTAFDVEYSFYKNGISTNNRLITSTVNIDANDFETVTAQWDNLVEGENKLWVTYSYNGQTEVEFYHSFIVQGLPNLRVTETILSPDTDIHSGDLISLSTKVTNIGSVDAPASYLGINYPGSITDVELQTPLINASDYAWVNTTFTAPVTGSYDLILTPDARDEILESTEQGKDETVSFVVEPRMDLSHVGEILISATDGSLIGPWAVSGSIARESGEGTIDVPMVIDLRDGASVVRSLQPFSVSVFGTGYSQHAWSTTIESANIAGLSNGQYTLAARIDPFQTGGFVQESTENDENIATFTLPQIPDVYVDPLALPNLTSVSAGLPIDWSMTATNTGDISVDGAFVYTWEGQSFQSGLISLQSGNSYTYTVSLATSLGSHTAELDVQWQPSGNSYDRNPTNSRATGSVLVEANLQLEWDQDTQVLVDKDGEQASFPLDSGEEYTLSLSMKSTRGSGNVTITCKNSQITWSVSEIVIENPGDREEVSCTFKASGKMTTVQLVHSPSSTMTSTFERSYSTAFVEGGGGANKENSGTGTAVLMFIGALVLIAFLVGAILLTRDSEDDVERDIYNYCPSCDGELEGDENRCPHCSFNLRKARSQFHECNACGESVPDLMENCPYCGTEQDVSSYFERRERRVRDVPEEKELVSLPDVDENEIVSGTEDFASAVKEFGYDEDNLEDEWDENVVAAEEEVTAAYDRRYADEISMEDMTDEEIEEMQNQVVTTLKTAKEAFEGHDLDAFLPTKDSMKSLKDDGTDKDGDAWNTLSASDADIREDLFELTGEDGVLPGDKVVVGMGLTDSSLAGNEITEASHNFSVEDDSKPLSIESDEPKKEAKPRRRPRRKAEPAKETADCGACGAVIAVDANECPTCGAKFE